MHGFATAPLWLIGLALTLVLVGAETLGARVRGWMSAGREPPANGGTLVAAALGLLALMFSFTYGVAQDRYDQRRLLVFSESRAVLTSYLRYQALPEPERDRLGRLMVDYAALRSRAIDAQVDRRSLAALVARTEVMQSEIWRAVLEGAARRHEVVQPVMQSTNEMFEVAAMRRAVVDARFPAAIQFALILFAVITAFLTGYELSSQRGRRIATTAVFLLFVCVYLLILELDRAYSGPVQVSQTPMVQVADRILRLEAAGKLAGPAIAPATGSGAPPAPAQR